MWINVLESLDEKAKLFLGKQIFTQIAPDQIYHFHLSENNNLIYDKFDVLRTSQYEPWAYNGPLVNKIYDLNNRLNVEKIVKENVIQLFPSLENSMLFLFLVTVLLQGFI